MLFMPIMVYLKNRFTYWVRYVSTSLFCRGLCCLVFSNLIGIVSKDAVYAIFIYQMGD